MFLERQVNLNRFQSLRNVALAALYRKPVLSTRYIILTWCYTKYINISVYIQYTNNRTVSCIVLVG